MTIKSLFQIILKVLGILYISDISLALPQLLSTFLYLGSGDVSTGIWNFVFTAVAVTFFAFVAWFLIFQSDWIIRKLRLTEGMGTEPLPLNMHRSTVLTLCVLVVGGYIAADGLPDFVGSIYRYWQASRISFSDTAPDWSGVALTGFRLLIGLLLLGQHRPIVAFIEWRRRKAAPVGTAPGKEE